MRTIGIDAHILLRKQKDGVPKYADRLLRAMMTFSLEEGEHVVLYANDAKPESIVLPSGWEWKVLNWPLPRGWTHGRLSLEMLVHPPDVLFVPAHEVPMFMRKQTKVVTTLHDVAFATTPNVYEPSAVRRQMLAVRRAIARVNHILVPSEATKSDLVHAFHVAEDRITVTPLAPALPLVQDDATELLRRAQVREKQYVFAMGRLEKKKNTLLLIRAFATMKRSLGQGHPFSLVLAGEFGYGEREIRAAIEQEGVAEDIRLLGYVSDHDASLFLQHAWCLAFPSQAEGFGMPILEAMEHGTPVIASNIPSTLEVAGDAALCISTNDIQAFARGMTKLLHDSAQYEHYKQAGFQRVQQFSWDACAKEALAVLRSLIR